MENFNYISTSQSIVCDAKSKFDSKISALYARTIVPDTCREM